MRLELARSRCRGLVGLGAGVAAALMLGAPSVLAWSPWLTTRDAASGRFERPSDAAATPRTQLAQAAPPGGVGAAVAIPATPAEPFVWSAEKNAAGSVTLGGSVPDVSTQSFLSLRAGEGVADQTELSEGAPPTFIRAASAGLRALTLLSTGTVAFDGSKWSMTGEASSDEVAGAARAALSTADPPPASWTIEIAVAAPVAAPTRPAAVPQPEIAAQEPVEDTDPPVPADVAAATDDESAEETPAVIAPPEPSPAPSPQLNADPAGPEEDMAAEPELGAAEPATPPMVAAIPETPATPAVAPQPPADFGFTASKRADGLVTLSGDVPDEPARRYLNRVAGTAAIDQMEVAGAGPEAFMTGANAGLRALLALTDGDLQLADGSWSLSGRAPDSEAETRVRELIAALPDAGRWTLGIEGPPPFAVCEEALVAFDARNPLLFRSGSAVLADQSTPVLDELASYLVKCPAAAVHVEGHTDADGAEDLNLILSVARAEAVVGALIDRGISADRLYAIGYGETLPIAPNDTQAGKQRNRRIVVTVVDEEQ